MKNESILALNKLTQKILINVCQKRNSRNREGSPEVVQATRWNDYVSNLACSRLVVEPAELSKISVDREVFQVLLGLPP